MFEFLKRFFSTEPDTDEVLTPSDDFPIAPHQKRVFSTRDFELPVVGIKYRQAALRNVLEGKQQYGRRAYFKVVLEAEPDNPHDENAVRVLVAETGYCVGYIPKEHARSYAGPVQQWADAGKWVGCDAVAVKSGSKVTGCYLDIGAPETIVAK